MVHFITFQTPSTPLLPALHYSQHSKNLQETTTMSSSNNNNNVVHATRHLLANLPNKGPYTFKDPKSNNHGGYNAFMKEWIEADTTSINAPPETRCVLPFGISAPFDKNQDPADVPRRSVDFEIRDANVIATLQAIDANNVAVACQKSADWWGKPKSREVIEHMYQPIVRQDAQGRWLMRTKANLWGDDQRSVMKVFKWEHDSATGKPYTKGSYTDVVQGVPAVGSIKFNGLYLKPESFMMQITTTKLVIWPSDVEEFDFQYSMDTDDPNNSGNIGGSNGNNDIDDDM